MGFHVLIAVCAAAGSALAADIDVKQADLAGSWYPASKEVLSSVLDSYLKEARVGEVNGRAIAIVAPHAGLMYSGPVAAYSYKAVADRSYGTVVILGFSHRKSFDGVSVCKEGSFNTPLGELPVDSRLASELLACDKRMIFYPETFQGENSVEMQLLFIKKVFPGAKIVPLAFGSRSFSLCETVADALADALKGRDDVLLVASTDMSHYHSEEKAREMDRASAELLKSFSARRIFDEAASGEQIFCGYMPVTAALLAAKKMGADEVDILQYANSGNVSGDMKNVVGYISAVIYKKEQQKNGLDAAKDGKNPEVKTERAVMINEAQRKKLLKEARDAITTYLNTGKVSQAKEDDVVLNKENGAFVTLRKRGELRGCIGNIIGSGPLYLTIRNMAVEAAVGDPRFPKVSIEEMKDIDIEISVLSDLEKISDVNAIQMGVHGVLVRKGFNSGVFLPQVAAETGWSREEFLTNLCAHKAGLLPDAWKSGDVDIYVFTAEVFGEKDDG